MTRIKRRRTIAYCKEVRVDLLLVEDLIAAAEKGGFKARDFRKIDDTGARCVLIELRETQSFYNERKAEEKIDSFLDEWAAASG